MKDKLKPCPFCGGEAILDDNGYDNFWWCKCSMCGCEMIGKEDQTQAIAEWNTRIKENN